MARQVMRNIFLLLAEGTRGLRGYLHHKQQNRNALVELLKAHCTGWNVPETVTNAAGNTRSRIQNVY